MKKEKTPHDHWNGYDVPEMDYFNKIHKSIEKGNFNNLESENYQKLKDFSNSLEASIEREIYVNFSDDSDYTQRLDRSYNILSKLNISVDGKELLSKFYQDLYESYVKGRKIKEAEYKPKKIAIATST